MDKELEEALQKFLDEYLALCEKLHTNQQEKMLLDKNSPYNVLKQALTERESKKYLKWEDLDTKPYTMKVKMGDNLYMLDWKYSNDDNYDNSKLVTLRALNGDWLFTLEKYFFDDLRLERVE